MVEQNHCSARIQCWWHREITTTGDWQVQQTRLVQKSKNLPTKFQFMDDFSHFWGISCATGLPHIGAKNRNILLLIDQCAVYPRDTTALKNTEVIFFPQIAQAICNQWIWGSSIVPNASTKRNSYIRQQQYWWRSTWWCIQNEDQPHHSSSLHHRSPERDETNHYREMLQEMWFSIRWWIQ